MSEKKSPPRKQEKIITVKTPQSDGKTLKRKLASPGSPTDDEADKRLEKTPKRKRGSQGLETSPYAGNGPANKTPTSLPRMGTHNVPLSERQQLAMIMRMTDETSQDSSPKHTSPSQAPIPSVKRTPGEKKVHKRNERGETQLHIAAKKGDIKLTKKLIKAGADVNVKDFADWTALHEACNHGCLAVAKQLLKAGANVNVQGLDKDTPLHDAAIGGHSKLVELLLKHGANPLQPNSKGKTAVDVAFSTDIEKLLRKEIISSSSESSSVDDLRSPTSPESTTSTKDDDRQVDIDDFALRVSSQVSSTCMTPTVMSRSDIVPMSSTSLSDSMLSSVAPGGLMEGGVSSSGEPYSSHLLPISMMSVAKRAVPKSPEGKTNSPRLFLKFRPKDTENVSCDSSGPKSKDPQYKSYSVTLETSELKGSPVNSASSNDSDLYNPQLDSGARLKFDHQLPVHNRNNGDSQIISNFSLDRQQTIIVNADGVHSLDSAETGHPSFLPSTGLARPPLVSLETGPFSPHFEDISDSEEDGDRLSKRTAERRTQPQQRANEDSRIPVMGVTECSNNSKDAHLDSRTGLFPPFHRSSSCVSGSKNSSRSLSPSEGSERTRHNSAPSRKSIHVSESSHVKKLDTLVPDQPQLGPKIPSLLGNKWDNRAFSSISSIPKSDVLVNLSQAQHSSESLQQSSPRSERGESSTGKPLLFKSDRDFRDSVKAPSRSQTPERDVVRSLFKSSEPKHMSPKVPPLKIILPAKTSSSMGHVDRRVGSPFSNPLALPYVVNPSNETGQGEAGQGCVSQDSSQASSTASSHPSSRASSPFSDNRGKVDISKIVDRLTSQAEEEEREAEGEREIVDDGGETEVDSSEQTLQDNAEIEKLDENKVEDKEMTTMVLRDRDKENEAGEKVQEDEQQQPVVEKELEKGEKVEKEKDVKEEKEERRITRSLRSHTQMLLQQQQQQQKSEKPEESTEADLQSEEGSTKTAETDENLVHKKRKLRPKPDTSGTVPDITPPPPIQYDKPQNPYELYLSIRNQVASRRNSLLVVPPKAPHGFKDYKTVNCSYVLHGNSASTLAVPMLSPPNSVTGPMRDLFVEQEKARYKLRLQHIVEREKLMLSIEQQVLRVNGRAARAMINQTLPLGACTVLKDEEIYNIFEVEQVDEREKNVSRTRYNGRQFLSWLQDVYDKFEKIKEYLLLRHHHEAESLFAVQKMEWDWKVKELGMCDPNSTPVIDELHLPMIHVNDEFDLLPA